MLDPSNWCLTLFLTMTPLGDLLTTGAAARYLGTSTETVRRWARSGYLPYTLLPSGRMRFRIEDLDASLSRVDGRRPA